MKETAGIAASIVAFLGLLTFCIWSQQQYTPVQTVPPSPQAPQEHTPTTSVPVPPPLASPPAVIPDQPPQLQSGDEPLVSSAPSVSGDQQAPPQQSQPQPLFTQVIEFPFSSATLTPQGLELLDPFLRELQQALAPRIVITGHADNSGPEEANIALSQQRADTVKRYLIRKGIPESWLTAEGVGSSQPIADNTTLSGRRQNRRTVIAVYPHQ